MWELPKRSNTETQRIRAALSRFTLNSLTIPLFDHYQKQPFEFYCTLSERHMEPGATLRFSNSPIPKLTIGLDCLDPRLKEQWFNCTESASLITGLRAEPEMNRKNQQVINYQCAGKSGGPQILRKKGKAITKAYMVKSIDLLSSINSIFQGVLIRQEKITHLFKVCYQALFSALVLLNKSSIYIPHIWLLSRLCIVFFPLSLSVIRDVGAFQKSRHLWQKEGEI